MTKIPISRRAGVLAVFALLLAAASARADEDPATRALREEVDRLRRRVEELEGRAGAGAAAAPGGDDSLAAAIERLSARGEGLVTAPRSRWIRLSGQIRLQAEDHSNFDFDESSGDELEFVGQRTRVTLDADVADALAARVTIQDSRRWGDEHSVTGDLHGVDLHEGWIDLDLGATTLRLGRQELSYGDQRLVSPLDWSLVGRAWDGVRGMFRAEGVRIDAFATRIDERGLGAGQDENEDFLGLYGSFDIAEGHVADAYVFWRRNRDADEVLAEDGTGGHEDLVTIGGRYAGAEGGFSYVVEAACQLGDHAGDDVLAWMAEAEASYGLDDAAWRPRFGAGLTLASGDDDPGDGERGTFDPLYTFSHFYLGWADRVGRRNLVSPRLFLDVRPSPELRISVGWHLFFLMTPDDALYAASGAALRGPAPGASRTVGHEIDLSARWRLFDAVSIWAGYARFFAGPFLDDTGPADDADFLFVQLTLDL